MTTVIKIFKRWFGRSLTCEDVNKFLVDYMDGSLPPRPRTLFDSHIAMCPNCRPYLFQYQKTVELVRETGAEVPDPPEELVEATMAFLKDHMNGF